MKFRQKFNKDAKRNGRPKIGSKLNQLLVNRLTCEAFPSRFSVIPLGNTY